MSADVGVPPGRAAVGFMVDTPLSSLVAGARAAAHGRQGLPFLWLGNHGRPVDTSSSSPSLTPMARPGAVMVLIQAPVVFEGGALVL